MMGLMHNSSFPSLQAIKFGEDDICQCSSFTSICREQRIQRFHVTFIDFLLNQFFSYEASNNITLNTYEFLYVNFNIFITILFNISFVLIIIIKCLCPGKSKSTLFVLIVLVLILIRTQLFLLFPCELEYTF